MITSVEEVYQLFFDKLEDNSNFFAYYGVSEQEAMNLAKERSSSYLKEAIVHLRRKAELGFELAVSATGSFVVAITDDEAHLLAEIMVLKFLDRKRIKLEPMVNAFAKAELNLLHSPAQERTSYSDMVKDYEENIREAISDYVAKDRISGANRIVDHTISEDE